MRTFDQIWGKSIQSKFNPASQIRSEGKECRCRGTGGEWRGVEGAVVEMTTKGFRWGPRFIRVWISSEPCEPGDRAAGNDETEERARYGRGCNRCPVTECARWQAKENVKQPPVLNGSGRISRGDTESRLCDVRQMYEERLKPEATGTEPYLGF
ncbi:hypothetical protein BU24DRAFT_407771 [Aaosphaeria arxii CBS 175.79]|uniref:Uncharacterized protein n=1 Tax=Aaosphaeria arxii CBS 175.79 TaxID=1450172 RepID=A0A6A5XYT1_9PLEO|nr:uncharacterized protein BU24DRAFT_407771 [Aaosphaeria arxii CBS 175.79]KAF2017790.1 hypothetical protein BU24DRAFT_407771 [Aaosphaeria arxii CBS 175.79]